MRHHQVLLAAGVFFAATAFMGCTSPPKPSLHGEQGFKEAVFDEKTLNFYLKDVPGLRFYNARRVRDDDEGSAMVIGMAKDSTDNYGEPGPHYRLSDKVVGNIVTYYVCNEARALQSIKWVKDAKEASYAVNFKSKDVEMLLDVKDCNGVRVSPERSTDDEHWSMRMTAVEIADGEVRDLGESVFCDEPCPTLCGTEPLYYLNMR